MALRSGVTSLVLSGKYPVGCGCCARETQLDDDLKIQVPGLRVDSRRSWFDMIGNLLWKILERDDH
jgi:hypothetical protein